MAHRVASLLLVVFSLASLGCDQLINAEFDAVRSRTPLQAPDIELTVVEGSQRNQGVFPEFVRRQSVKYRMARAPRKGTATLAGAQATFTYASTPGQWGLDAFTYHVLDGEDRVLAWGAVKLTILPSGPTPVSVDPRLVPELNHVGISVDVDGDVAVVGGADRAEFRHGGRTYILRRQLDGSWRIAQALDLGAYTRPGTDFGFAVAIDGPWVLVGAPAISWYQAREAPSAGEAFFFKRGADGLFSLAERKTLDGPLVAQFGYSVQLDGRRAIVGAPIENGADGAVYTYYLSENDEWILDERIPTPSTAPYGYFGYDVDIEGDRFVASAPFDYDVAPIQGTVHVFERKLTWQREERLIPRAEGIWGFGSQIALSEDTVLVSAHTNDRSGVAFAYARQGHGSWSSQLLTPPVPHAWEFGYDVALSADLAVVSMLGLYYSGQAFVYRRERGSWSEVRRIDGGTGQVDAFGVGLAVDGTTIAAGALWHVPNGAVYFFNVPPSGVE